MSRLLPEGWNVTAQRSERAVHYPEPHQVVRWAYVVEHPGFWPNPSAYRYGSEEAALRAGHKDAEQAWPIFAALLAAQEVSE